MSPILLRPVREQLEHDRVIRLLQVRYRRRHQVAINVGSEQTAPVSLSGNPVYPDLVLTSNEGGRRVEGVVEVETAESVNNMEALAEWAPFGRLRSAFYLYIPNGSVDTARRLIADNNIAVSEVWSYYLVGDQMRFAMVHKAPVVTRTTAPRPAASRERAASGGSRTKTVTRRPAKTARTRRAAESRAASSGRSGRARATAKRAARKPAKRTARTSKRR